MPDPAFHAGDKVQVEWEGMWWPARVVAPAKGGRLLVHYDGWEDDWDEEVPLSRVRKGSARANVTAQAFPAMAIGAPPVCQDALQEYLCSQPVTTSTPLRVGDKVRAEWAGFWWEAEVSELHRDGRVKIHYAGWDDSWDESVPRGRLRLHTPESRLVTLHLEGSLTLAGVLEEVRGDYLVLRQDRTHRRLLVNRHKVIYAELG